MSISFRPVFTVDGSFETSSQYIFDFNVVLDDDSSVFVYLEQIFTKGHIRMLTINYYPAGKHIVDLCNEYDIPVRDSVNPVGFFLNTPEFLDDVYNSFIRFLDVEIDHPN